MGFAFYIEVSWFPFICLQKIVSLFISLATECLWGRGLKFRDTAYRTRPNKGYSQQPIFAVTFSASEMKIMYYGKHCTGVANNLILRRWCFGGIVVTISLGKAVFK